MRQLRYRGLNARCRGKNQISPIQLAGHGGGHGRRLPVPEPGAPLDVGEQQRKAVVGYRDLNSVEVVAEQFVERHAKKRVKEWRNVERWLESVVVPEWQERTIQSIKRSDIQALLDKVVEERSAAAAIEVRKHLSAMFNWVVDRDEHGLTASPSDGSSPRR